ncbi:uncharacterized protein LOC119169462 isoform X2 [Rhipicephalus microplus]|uniref:uncharacterized protein LOC119169462 isoform X2 n=1 Tax=Rhipicephalus microplus TaxID=6941 RepID=UPI003F6C4ADB
MVQRISHSSRDFVTSLHKAREGSETRMVNRIVALGLVPYTFTTTSDNVELDRLYAHVPDQKDANYLDNYLHLTRITAQYMVSLLLDTSANTSRFFMPPFRMEMPHLITVYNTVHLGLDSVMPPIDKSFSLNYAVIGHSVVQQGVDFRLHQCAEEEVPVPEENARGAEVDRQQCTKARLGGCCHCRDSVQCLQRFPPDAAKRSPFPPRGGAVWSHTRAAFFRGPLHELVSTQRRAA